MKILNLDSSPRGEIPCKEAREWFSQKFPKGATVPQLIRACPRGDWLIWGLWNFKQTTIEQIIMAGCAAGRLSLRFAREQDRSLCVAAFDAADAVAYNNTEQTRAAAGAAARAARAAAVGAAWAAGAAASAAWDARAALATAVGAARAAGDAEHLACADAIRKLMRTARYKRAGRNKS